MKSKLMVVLGVVVVLGLVGTGCDALFGKDDDDTTSSGLNGTTWVGTADGYKETVTFTASSFLIVNDNITTSNAGSGSYTLDGETVTFTYTSGYYSYYGHSTQTGIIVGNKLSINGYIYTKQ